MVGCSDKDTVVENPSQNVEDFDNGAYLGISLSLPTADNNVTRANDSLSNGTAEEFAVMNATLYIFRGAASGAEKDAKFVKYVSLGTKYEQDDQPGINPDEWNLPTPRIDTKITSTSISEATRIPNTLASEIKADQTNQYYAYVIINHNSQVPDNLVSAMDNEEGATTFGSFSDVQFSEIGADIAAEKNIHEGGLLMTNAPICSKPGGSAAPADGAKYSTLVPLDKSKIFGSVAQAKAEPAACVYVERAAVKITVEDNLGSATLDGYNVSIEGWQVINNEKTYYNTRHINYSGTAAEDWGPYFNENVAAARSHTKYRFVSINPFEPTKPSDLKEGYEHTLGYRTYFAYDPHYNTDATNDGSGNTTLANTVATDSRWITKADGKTHAYTTENTFDVVHQTWRNTTMVTIKVQLKKNNAAAADFYTVGKGGQTMFPKTDAEATIHNLILNDPTVAAKVEACLTELATTYPNEVIKPVLTVTLASVSSATTGVGISYTIGFKHGTTDVDNYSGTNLTNLTTAINEYIHPKEGSTLQTDKYNDPVLVSLYKGGISYYNVRIQHFGEFETPWSATGSYISGGGANVNEIYGIGQNPDKSKERFLGRYGVVRDNWYKLSITGITKIGSATPVDPSLTTPDTPDDEIENYLSVHVHILPWVLREQGVTL